MNEINIIYIFLLDILILSGIYFSNFFKNYNNPIRDYLRNSLILFLLLNIVGIITSRFTDGDVKEFIILVNLTTEIIIISIIIYLLPGFLSYFRKNNDLNEFSLYNEFNLNILEKIVNKEDSTAQITGEVILREICRIFGGNSAYIFTFDIDSASFKETEKYSDLTDNVRVDYNALINYLSQDEVKNYYTLIDLYKYNIFEYYIGDILIIPTNLTVKPEGYLMIAKHSGKLPNYAPYIKSLNMISYCSHKILMQIKTGFMDQEKTNTFKILLNEMPILYFTLDKNMNINNSNSKMNDFFKHKVSVLKGCSLHRIFPEATASEIENVSNYIFNDKMDFLFKELEFYDESGNSHYGMFNFTKYNYSHPYRTEIVIIIIDFTERKLTKENMSMYKRKTEELQKELERSYLKSENLKKLIDNSNTIKNSFLATMSHELRTPLNGIVGMAELLEESNLNSEQMKFLKTIQYSSKQLLDIINDIFDFTRIDSGQITLESNKFNVWEAIENTFEISGINSEKKDLKFYLSISNNTPEFMSGDEKRLKQILLNLINNAVKYTLKGYVKVSVEKTRDNDEMAELTFKVKDSGIGISQKDQENLFLEFRQLDSTINRKYSGSGLGLSISKRLAGMMYGSIGVVSAPRKGSEFYFTAFLHKDSDSRTVFPAYNSDDFNIVTLLNDTELTDIIAETISIFKLNINYRDPSSAECIIPAKNNLVIINNESVNEHAASMLNHTGIKYNLIVIGRESAAENETLLVNAGKSTTLLNPLKKTELIKTIVSYYPQNVPVVNSNEIPQRETRGFNMEKILIVEDNPVNQKLFASILKELNLDADIANNGLECVEKYSEMNYNMIFMDIHMPVMNGFEAASLIRKDNGEIPIVAVTADILQTTINKCKESGINEIISKPYHKNDILNILEKYIGT